MSLESVTKLIPPSMLAKMLKKHLIPALKGLSDLATKDVELEDGEAEIQVLMITRPGVDDIPDMNYAVVVALDSELNIVRKVKQFNLDRLIDGFDPKNLTK